MPSIDWNWSMWGEVHSWPCQGSEWSVAWGGVEAQWFTTIFPRIRRFLPARRILEIAPGYGRWSDYLLHLSEIYTGVDLAETCVKACKERFSTAPNATFALNDGKSLPMVSDASVDFVFSFDSLVHAEADVIESYLTELSRVLTPDGIGFIHHSNLGTLLPALIAARMIEKMARKVQFARRKLQRLGVVDWDHARAKSMTADRFARACEKVGLVCVGQEIISWGDARKMIDCISLVARSGSRWERPNIVILNPDFMAEASSAQRLASIHRSLQGRSSDVIMAPTETITS